MPALLKCKLHWVAFLLALWAVQPSTEWHGQGESPQTLVLALPVESTSTLAMQRLYCWHLRVTGKRPELHLCWSGRIALCGGRTSHTHTCSARCLYGLFCSENSAVRLGCLLPWWTPTGDSVLRSNLCLAQYNQLKLVSWPAPCEQGELLIACLSTVSFHTSQVCCTPFQLETKYREFPSNSDPLGQVLQMFDHHCCFPELPVYAHGGLLSLRLLAQSFLTALSHLK